MITSLVIILVEFCKSYMEKSLEFIRNEEKSWNINNGGKESYFLFLHGAMLFLGIIKIDLCPRALAQVAPLSDINAMGLDVPRFNNSTPRPYNTLLRLTFPLYS